MKKNTKKGFTLVELLVVIAILAILSSVAVVGYTAFIDKAKQSNADTEAAQIAASIKAALLVEDYVQVATNVYVQDADHDGVYVVITELPTGKTAQDLSSDFVGTLAKDSNNNLQYTSSNGKTSTVITGATAD